MVFNRIVSKNSSTGVSIRNDSSSLGVAFFFSGHLTSTLPGSSLMLTGVSEKTFSAFATRGLMYPVSDSIWSAAAAAAAREFLEPTSATIGKMIPGRMLAVSSKDSFRWPRI